MNLREDVGFYAVSKESEDIGRFATPSLWEVGQTGPYMHSGVFETLEEVIAFYDAGGGAHPNKTEMLQPLGLSEDEKSALLAFLNSLTGSTPAITAPDLPDYSDASPELSQ